MIKVSNCYGTKLINLNKYNSLLECLSRKIQTKSIKPSYLHNVGKEPLTYRNFGEHLDVCVEKYGDQEAVVSCCQNKRLTFLEIKENVNRLAAGLSKLGLNPGDRIGIWAPNKIEWYLTMLAAARAGLVSVGMNPVSQGPEIEYCIKKAGIKALVTTDTFRLQNYYEILKTILPNLEKFHPGNIKSENLPTLKSVIVVSNNQMPGTYQFQEILNSADKDSVNKIHKLQSKISPDDAINIQFTSGTTGKPKAAVISHYGIVNNGLHIARRNELDTKVHRICCQVPFFHAFGVVIAISAALGYGSTIVLPSDGFNPEHSLEAIVEEKCTVIYGTPTMYVDLINKQLEKKFPLKTAEIAVTGGAPCSPQLFRNIKQILGLKKVKTVFGMTENTAVSFQSKISTSDEQVLNTVGHMTDHIEAKVVDLKNNVVPFGQPGELCVRGYFTMLEYFDDIEKTNEILGKDKWLRTGDQFILEENGYGRIVGRIKEMIIRGGENVFPKEIEDFLNTHPNIIESYVVGVADDRLGEEICAYIRLRNGLKKIEIWEIKEFCKGKISDYKIPKYIRVVEEFPKTTSGKIQKFKLKESFKQ